MEAKQQAESGTQGPSLPSLPPLPTLSDNDPAYPRDGNVKHTFQATRSYCVQIASWACGMPIAAAKLYTSESETQVIAFLDKVWPKDAGHLLPDYIAYNQACFLLRQLATHNIASPWIQHVRLIVDAWHYIGHRADDIVCRTRCNPAPVDGSQPDLVVEEVDGEGRVHKKRAFNTEVAEQLNAWFDRFKGALNRMTDYNFDFVVHCVLFLYSRDWEYRKEEKRRRLQRVQERHDARDAEARDVGMDVDGAMGSDLDQSGPDSGNSSDVSF